MTRFLAVYDGSDNLLMRFDYADERMPVSMIKGGNTYYLTYDQVDSLRVVADAIGNVVKRIDYDSFGNIIDDSNLSFEIPFGFGGGLYDKDTDLIRFGFRDYDSDIGRWTTKDPILFYAGNTDLYGYCLNDPITFVDPSGLQALIGYQIRRMDGTTKMYFYDQVYGIEYVFEGLKENAPLISPKTKYAYGYKAKLPPFQWYRFEPRPDPKTKKVRIKKGWPVYTTPRQPTGVVIDPCGKARTWIGPHPPRTPNTISSGCPLFPYGREGELEHQRLVYLIQYYAQFGGTMIYVWEE